MGTVSWTLQSHFTKWFQILLSLVPRIQTNIFTNITYIFSQSSWGLPYLFYTLSLASKHNPYRNISTYLSYISLRHYLAFLQYVRWSPLCSWFQVLLSLPYNEGRSCPTHKHRVYSLSNPHNRSSLLSFLVAFPKSALEKWATSMTHTSPSTTRAHSLT